MDKEFIQRILRYAEQNPINTNIRSSGLANIGIPIGMLSRAKDLTSNGLAVMPDGSVYAEASTFDNDAFSPRQIALDIRDRSRDVDFGNHSGAKRINRAMLKDISRIRPKQVGMIRDNNSFFGGYAGSGTQGLYDPARRTIQVRRDLPDRRKKIILDHEVGHAVQQVPFSKMYQSSNLEQGRVPYQNRIRERVSHIFAGRQMPEIYSDPESDAYIHPLAIYDGNQFVNGTDAFIESSSIARPANRRGFNLDDEYNIKMQEHINELNRRLNEDENFRNDIAEYWNEDTAQQADLALKQ